MAHEDQVLDFLRSISPRDATNSEIVSHTGIRPHQQVFQLTQKLYKSGRIKGSGVTASGGSGEGRTND